MGGRVREVEGAGLLEWDDSSVRNDAPHAPLLMGQV